MNTLQTSSYSIMHVKTHPHSALVRNRILWGALICFAFGLSLLLVAPHRSTTIPVLLDSNTAPFTGDGYAQLTSSLHKSNEWTMTGATIKKGRPCEVYQHKQQAIVMLVDTKWRSVIQLQYGAHPSTAVVMSACSFRRFGKNWRAHILKLMDPATHSKRFIRLSADESNALQIGW